MPGLANGGGCERFEQQHIKTAPPMQQSRTRPPTPPPTPAPRAVDGLELDGEGVEPPFAAAAIALVVQRAVVADDVLHMLSTRACAPDVWLKEHF
jgi:hypothetical protein